MIRQARRKIETYNPAERQPHKAGRKRRHRESVRTAGTFQNAQNIECSKRGLPNVIWATATPQTKIALRLGRTIFFNLVHNLPDTLYRQDPTPPKHRAYPGSKTHRKSELGAWWSGDVGGLGAAF